MNELIRAYHEIMEKYELGYEKMRVQDEAYIKRVISIREEEIAAIKEMGWDPMIEERVVKTIIDGSEAVISHRRQTAEESISRMRKKDSSRTAAILGIPDPLANS